MMAGEVQSIMKVAIFICLANLLVTSVLKADQEVSFPKKAPLIDMAFPDEWEVKPKQGVIYAHPKEDASYFMSLSAMEATSADPEAAMLEAKTGIEELFKNVKYSEPETIEAGGLDVMLVNAKGKDEDGVANINLWLIAKKGVETVVMLKCVSSQAAFEKYGELGGEIINTIAAHGEAGEGEVLTYHYPDEANPAFTMAFPADWGMDADEKGAYLVAPDKQFTLNVIPIAMEHIEDGLVNITKQVSAKYDSVVWNEGGEPKVHIDEATGQTLITSEGVAKGGGIEHKVSVYQFAKKGAEKFFVLSAWSPAEMAEAKGAQVLAILESIQLN